LSIAPSVEPSSCPKLSVWRSKSAEILDGLHRTRSEFSSGTGLARLAMQASPYARRGGGDCCLFESTFRRFLTLKLIDRNSQIEFFGRVRNGSAFFNNLDCRELLCILKNSRLPKMLIM
jgi:hypothetical protein